MLPILDEVIHQPCLERMHRFMREREAIAAQTSRRTIAESLSTISRPARSFTSARAPSPNAARDRAVDRLLLFAASLDAEEIELVMDVGGAAVKHVQRAQSQVSTNSSLKRAARRP